MKLFNSLLLLLVVLLMACAANFALSSSDDLYGELGVGRRASEHDIKKAFRRLSKEWHPDVSSHDNAKERYAKILRAYDVLSNKDKRRMFDLHGVVEGENGVPTAEERKRRGGGGFGMNPFDFFGGGGGGGFQHHYGGGFQESFKISLGCPELTVERFSRLKTFRGPRLFVVFGYADVSTESRIFAPAWERVSVSHGDMFKNLVGFFRVNVNTDEFVMELAGLEPQDLPLVFVVRDGSVSVIDADAIQIMPQNPAGMAEVLSMYVQDYANSLLSAANSAATAVSTREHLDALLKESRFQTVVAIDRSRPDHDAVNPVACAAALRATLADIKLVFIDNPHAVFGGCTKTKNRFRQEVVWVYRVEKNSNNKQQQSPSTCSPQFSVPFSSGSMFTHANVVRSITSNFLRMKQSKEDALVGARPSAVLQHGSPFKLVTADTVSTLVFGAPSSSASGSSNGVVMPQDTVSIVQVVSGKHSPLNVPLVSDVLSYSHASQTKFAALNLALLDADMHPKIAAMLHKLQDTHHPHARRSSNSIVSLLVVTSSAVCFIPVASIELLPTTKLATFLNAMSDSSSAASGSKKTAAEVCANSASVFFSSSAATRKDTTETDKTDKNTPSGHLLSEQPADFFENNLEHSTYPADAWYTGPMRWFFWGLRRLPGGMIVLVVIQLLVVKVLKPMLGDGGGAAAAATAGGAMPQRNVPSASSSGNGSASAGGGAWGFAALRDGDLSNANSLYIVAMTTGGTPASNNRPPPAELAQDFLSIRGLPEVELRGLTPQAAAASNSNNNRVTVNDVFTKVSASEAFRSACSHKQANNNNNNNNNAIVVIAVRVGRRARAAVMAPGRKLVSWVERLLDGSEPMPIVI